MLNKDEVIWEKSQAGVMYEDDECLKVMSRVVFEENLVSKIRRACLIEKAVMVVKMQAYMQ